MPEQTEQLHRIHEQFKLRKREYTILHTGTANLQLKLNSDYEGYASGRLHRLHVTGKAASQPESGNNHRTLNVAKPSGSAAADSSSEAGSRWITPVKQFDWDAPPASGDGRSVTPARSFSTKPTASPRGEVRYLNPPKTSGSAAAGSNANASRRLFIRGKQVKPVVPPASGGRRSVTPVRTSSSKPTAAPRTGVRYLHQVKTPVPQENSNGDSDGRGRIIIRPQTKVEF